MVRLDLLWEGAVIRTSFIFLGPQKNILSAHTRESWKSEERNRDNAFDTTKGTVEGQRDEDLDAVSLAGQEGWLEKSLIHGPRGLDNAGKTTIVKRIMKEDVTTVSPTLGFIIKTIDFQG